MRIICPTCACHYEVDTDRVGAAGQLVRCAECRDVWLVRRTDEPARPSLQPASPRAVADKRTAGAPAALRAGTAADEAGAGPIDFMAARSRLRRRGAADSAPRVRGSTGTVLAIAAVCAAMAGVSVGFRAAIVTRVPQAAPAFAAVGLPVAADGLALQDVRSVVSAEGGRTVLDLQGRIANLQDKAVAVPDLTVVVRDTGSVPLYSWNAAAPKPSLAAGESVAFRTRLSAPPTGGKDVRVSFAEIGPDRR